MPLPASYSNCGQPWSFARSSGRRAPKSGGPGGRLGPPEAPASAVEPASVTSRSGWGRRRNRRVKSPATATSATPATAALRRHLARRTSIVTVTAPHYHEVGLGRLPHAEGAHGGLCPPTTRSPSRPSGDA